MKGNWLCLNAHLSHFIDFTLFVPIMLDFLISVSGHDICSYAPVTIVYSKMCYNNIYVFGIYLEVCKIDKSTSLTWQHNMVAVVWSVPVKSTWSPGPNKLTAVNNRTPNIVPCSSTAYISTYCGFKIMPCGFGQTLAVLDFCIFSQSYCRVGLTASGQFKECQVVIHRKV